MKCIRNNYGVLVLALSNTACVQYFSIFFRVVKCEKDVFEKISHIFYRMTFFHQISMITPDNFNLKTFAIVLIVILVFQCQILVYICHWTEAFSKSRKVFAFWNLITVVGEIGYFTIFESCF